MRRNRTCRANFDISSEYDLDDYDSAVDDDDDDNDDDDMDLQCIDCGVTGASASLRAASETTSYGEYSRQQSLEHLHRHPPSYVKVAHTRLPSVGFRS